MWVTCAKLAPTLLSKELVILALTSLNWVRLPVLFAQPAITVKEPLRKQSSVLKVTSVSKDLLTQSLVWLVLSEADSVLQRVLSALAACLATFALKEDSVSQMGCVILDSTALVELLSQLQLME